jgi:hypothetical protein
VEFKREVHVTGTASDRAELVKDVLGLANTQASGRRWLIIGLDNHFGHDWPPHLLSRSAPLYTTRPPAPQCCLAALALHLQGGLARAYARRRGYLYPDRSA